MTNRHRIGKVHTAMALAAGAFLILAGCVTDGANEPDHGAGQIRHTLALPSLPQPVSNNAVARVATEEGHYLVSFAGLLKEKRWSDTTAATYVLEPGARAWSRAPDVPGDEGRLASIAVAAAGHAYVFGGYTVAEDHSEVSLPLVHRFDPVSQEYVRLADMPVPVDDAMALVYQDRYIYLVSGWHDTANVNLVQRYDIEQDTWVQATAYPGAPVFGHAGGIVGRDLVVCGGVKIKTHREGPREFVIGEQCFAGTIRDDDARRIDWRVIEPMPDAARYRAAAAGSEALRGVVFVGGSDNPYNYNGIGYNGTPSAPENTIWLFDVEVGRWVGLGHQPLATMDHRALLETPDGFVTIGGMLQDQKVTDRVIATPLSRPVR